MKTAGCKWQAADYFAIRNSLFQIISVFLDFRVYKAFA